MGKNGFYAVRVGRVLGVYSDWNTCMEQTGGYSGAVFRGFKTRDEALAWLRQPEFIRRHTLVSGYGFPVALMGCIAGLPCVRVPCLCYVGNLKKSGNPGPAGGGVFIVNELGETVYKAGVGFGVGTNNMAEYRALITGLRIAVNLGASCLVAHGDSQLVVCQINGEYKVGPEMAPYHREVLLLSQYLQSFCIRWIPRVENNVADSLAAYGVTQVIGDGRFVSEFPLDQMS